MPALRLHLFKSVESKFYRFTNPAQHAFLKMKNILFKTHQIIKETLPYTALAVLALFIYNTKQIHKIQIDLHEIQTDTERVREVIENNSEIIIPG